MNEGPWTLGPASRGWVIDCRSWRSETVRLVRRTWPRRHISLARISRHAARPALGVVGRYNGVWRWCTHHARCAPPAWSARHNRFDDNRVGEGALDETNLGHSRRRGAPGDKLGDRRISAAHGTRTILGRSSAGLASPTLAVDTRRGGRRYRCGHEFMGSAVG